MLRLRQIALVARELAPVVDDLRAVFGLEVAYRDPGVASFGLENAVLPVGSQFVEVVAPVREGTAGGRYLERRGGDGGYMVILQCDDHAARKAKVDELGIRKVLEHDEPDYSIMQLHPQDTGGSFLEIDVQVGGESLDGPWKPAGPDWQAARRDRPRAGHRRGRDPVARPPWAGRAVEPSCSSAPVSGDGTIKLDNAWLRFVEATDGRGEGLGGVDLLAADRDAVVEAATARGLLGTDGVVLLGGVRFRLVGVGPG